MPFGSPHTGFCYTVVVPTPVAAMFVRGGYEIRAGDRAWQVSCFPPLPNGFVALEARTADWGIVWMAHFALEHLLPVPEPVDYVSGCPQNPRPVRPEVFTLLPAPPHTTIRRTQADD